MIVFSSRAFNVATLLPICKSMLNDRTMDPFLHLVHENKLQAVKDYTEDPSTFYGSAEDNQNALKSLSAVELTNSCSRESMVFAIMNSITDLPDLELENIRSQLLRDFSPDEMCPASAHFLESPGKIARPSSDDDTDYQEAELIDLRNDNNTFAEFSATTLTATAIPVPTTNLLSIDELLETVMNDTSSQTRAQSMAGDIPFQEMTSHCEALSMGKHHKMSLLMSFKQNKQAATAVVPENQVNRDEAAHTSNKQNTNPFLRHSIGAEVAQVAGVVQQPFLRLPASSPYDNFLKAAGC